MSKPAKPFPLRKTVAIGLALAAAFSILSLFHLYSQARNGGDRLAGEVIAVAGPTITIRSARGTETMLTLPPDAKLRGVSSVSEIAEGQHVMTTGKFTDGKTFLVERLRLVADPDLK